MTNRQEISAELRETSPIMAEHVPVNPYALPSGYFNSFAALVMEKIRAEAILEGGSVPTYQVPGGYFEGLAGNILARLQQVSATGTVSAELDEIAPLLNTISRQDPYMVPQGYFAGTDFAEATHRVKKPAGVFRLKTARRWIQYAAAAMVAGVLVTTAVLFTDGDEVTAYEQYTALDIPTELNKLKEEELVQYLDSHENYVIAAEMAVPVAEEATGENVPVQTLSDEELDQYLKEDAELPAKTSAETDS